MTQEEADELHANWKAENEAREAHRSEMQKHAPSLPELHDIRDLLTLSHYVGQTVLLEPARWANGKLIPHELQGKCPAPDHPNDEQKSFYVSDRMGIFHCYGCCIHGDIIRFIQDFQGKSFPDTMAFIRNEVGRVTIQQDIIRDAAATALAKKKPLPLLDSWTPNGKVRVSTRGTKATRQQLDPTRLFNRNISALRKIDTLWLTQETHWLDGDRKVTIEAPQTRHDLCTIRHTSTRYHEAEARHKPDYHGRFNGSITLARTGIRTLVATVRLAGHPGGAATVQLRRNPKPKNPKSRKTPRVSVRLLSFLGTQEGIVSGLEALNSFFSHRAYVEYGLRQAAQGGKNFHPSYDPMRMEGRSTSVTSKYADAGMPGSPERVHYEKLFASHTPGLLRRCAWAQRELKAG